MFDYILGVHVDEDDDVPVTPGLDSARKQRPAAKTNLNEKATST